MAKSSMGLVLFWHIFIDSVCGFLGHAIPLKDQSKQFLV